MKTKTKVLFVVRYLGQNGTTSALMSILNSKLTEYCDFSVFAICQRNITAQPIIDNEIGLNSLTTGYYGNYTSFNVKDKLKYLWIKFIKQNKRWSTRFEGWITSKVISRIEHNCKYDFIIGFQEGLATRFASHFSCPRRIAWIHCDYAHAFGNDINELDIYNCFERIVCVSLFTRKGFVDRYPSLEKKTIAIHNIFDEKRVLELSKSRIDDSRFDSSVFTIISLGRVHEVKRFYLIPEIAAKVKQSGQDFHWYILGNADIPDELQRLNDAIHRYRMDQNVIHLGGKSNPYPYIKDSDLMVSVSESEACPMIFNEAKILNVPILSSDFGSAFEFILQEKDGYISSIEKLPDRLIELIKQKNLDTTNKTPSSYVSSNSIILEGLFSLFTKE